MKPYYLYKIENKVNGKLYIGVTKNPEQRKKAHFFSRSQKARSLIKNAIDKYGVENFDFSILCIGERDYIFNLEAKAVDLYKTLSPFGYNIKPGGYGGFGHEVEKRIDDAPVYITGFWFPNMRTALKATKMNKTTVYNRLRVGIAGETFLKANVKTPKGSPVYVAGIWWPCVTIASEKLSIKVSTLRKRIRENTLEAALKPKQVKGESHRLYGKTGALCPNSKPVLVEGVRYVSIKEAVLSTKYSEESLRKRLKSSKYPDFEYL